jgi:glyoxylase I family protein
MKLEHVAINVQEPEAVAAWYQEHLGMKIVMAQTTDTRMHFIADEGGSMLELYNNPAGELSINGDIHPFSLHFAFSTDDIEADRQRLIEAGATPVGEITESPVALLAFLRDPWDLPIQLVRRFKPLV